MIADLDSDHFDVRNRAERGLAALGASVATPLRLALTPRTPAEARMRIERILDELKGPITNLEVLRSLRAIAALERVGNTEARETLEELAKGDPTADATVDAADALRRLSRGRPRTAARATTR